MKWPGTNRLCNLQNYYYCLFFIVGIESNWCHLHAYFFYFSDLVAGSFPKEVIRCQKCSMLGRLLYRTACVPFLSNFLGMGPNQMNFQKYSKRPSTPPPPSFSENHIAIFYDRYGCIYARRYDGHWPSYLLWPDSMKCMHMISRNKDHSEGWGWGQLPFGTFPKIHPIW